MSFNTVNTNVLVRIFCAVLLLFVTFAHKPQTNIPNDINLAKYMLPDGSYPVFCLPSTSNDGSRTIKNGACEYCRLCSAIILPSQNQNFQTVQITTTHFNKALFIEHNKKPPYNPANPSQGPPKFT